MSQFKYFVGIDTSKKKFDICPIEGKVVLDEFVIDNSYAELNKLMKRLKLSRPDLKRGNTLFCVEHTGIYNNHLLNIATRRKWNLVIEPAIHIKKSSGLQRGKSDRVDAKRIARYAYKNRDELKLWKPMSKTLATIKVLQTQRRGLVKARKSLKQTTCEDAGFERKVIAKMKGGYLAAPLKALTKAIQGVERRIDQLIKSDLELCRLDEIVTSVMGIGRENSVTFLVRTNAFNNIRNPRQYACYGGIAPFEHSSGSSYKGKSRTSKMANLEVKTLLQMAAVNAKKHDKEINQYYHKKLAEGKCEMNIMNAIRNKLIHRVFACVRDNRLYSKDYKPQRP